LNEQEKLTRKREERFMVNATVYASWISVIGIYLHVLQIVNAEERSIRIQSGMQVLGCCLFLLAISEIITAIYRAKHDLKDGRIANAD
jgi:fumarate reductase subunit D